MDRRTFALMEALKTAALERGEMRLYRRGRLHGLFAQRTRLNAELASQAVQDGLLEVARSETIGKTLVEWVRITQKGLDVLMDSESPVRALQELRAALTVSQEGLPMWAVQMHTRFGELADRLDAEIDQMKGRLEQLAERVTATLERLEAAQPQAATPSVPWAQETLAYLDRRKQVGLGERCSLADLFGALREQHSDLSIKDFHTGLKRLHEREVVTLLPSTANGDAPGPEYALLDGPAVYYYVGRTTRLAS